VTVNDVELPQLMCPAGVVGFNDAGLCTAVVDYNLPVGSDNCAGFTTTLTDGLGDGAAFPVGTTIEEYTTTDASGNQRMVLLFLRIAIVFLLISIDCAMLGVCTFTIKTDDNEAPTMNCPADYEIAADSDVGASYDLTRDLANIADDNCALQSTTITNPSSFAPAQLNIGDNQITGMAIDVNGNDHTCSYNVKVVPIGACCGGDVDNNCQNDYTRQQCNTDNGQFKVNGVCANDCGKLESVY
jgi:hypothetical protein